MICIEKQYFNLNKVLLRTVGLWPYQQTKLVRFQFIFFLGILTTGILFQFTVFLTSKCTSYFAVRVLSIISFFSTFLIKYISFAFNMKTVKNLLAQLQRTYDNIKDEYENIIIEKYSYKAKWYTVILTSICMIISFKFFVAFAICSVFSLVIIQVWSNNVISSKNASQSRDLFIMTEYFIDEKKHFYLIVMHIYTAISVGCIVVVSIGTMLIAYLQHTCGMFRISSYRIKRVMGTNMLQNITLKKENLIFEGIICAINIHRQAMNLSELLVSKFEMMLFCLIGIGVVSLSLNLFQISTSKDIINECSISTVFVIASILYMFIANYVGQDVINHTNHVYVTAYSVQWYLAPLRIQRIILFLLQRGTKNFTLSVGGLFIGSLECFATLVKASVSYFTVIYTVQ